jgi:hypothetical protein
VCVWCCTKFFILPKLISKAGPPEWNARTQTWGIAYRGIVLPNKKNNTSYGRLLNSRKEDGEEMIDRFTRKNTGTKIVIGKDASCTVTKTHMRTE